MRPLVTFAFILLIKPFAFAKPAQAFSFHLFSEPAQLDPQLSSNTSGSYLTTNIFRGLYRYSNERGLIPEMAERCTRTSSTELICHIKKTARWSDGLAVTAQQFVLGFRELIDPKNKSSQADLLFTIQNARSIWKGNLSPEKLGVIALNEQTLKFQFAEPDAEFEFKLIHPALSPRRIENVYQWKRATLLLVNGPYQIAEWKQGHHIKLIANKYYDTQSEERPKVSIYFVDSDSTALRLYESGELKFLRRLVATEVPRFKSSPEFYQLPMARFDYIGFGPQLQNEVELRRAFALSADFKVFKRIFDALGEPGCPSLPMKWLDKRPCIQPNIALAKSLLKSRSTEVPRKLFFGFSQLGGEDIQRSAEWFQGQWSKNIGINVSLQSKEQGAYIQLLQAAPPPLFRKGVSLDRPTCAAALEIFTSAHPENYVRYSNPEYDKLVTQLKQQVDPLKRRILCRKAVDLLISSYLMIPLGEMHFTFLAKAQFRGWQINELNQLDLTDLRLVE